MRFEDLSEAEGALWDAFPAAETVDLRIGDAARDDPTGGHSWGPDRSVRAEVVAALLLGARAAEPGRVPAVRLSGARVTGVLDLSFADVAYAWLLRDCFFDEEPQLAGMRSRQVNLSRSYVPGLQVSDAQIDGLLWLSGCRFNGPVRLTGAHVAGTLSLRGAELRGDPALQANSLTVGRDMQCAKMAAYGECVLRNATVRGTLIFDSARLECPGGTALAADGLIAERGIFCLEGFTADGQVRLQDARVGQRLSFAGASLRNPGATALSAERLTVSGALRLDDGFSATGQVLLHAATIRGELDLGGAALSNPSGVALNAGNATIEAGLYAMGGFSATGEVQFGGAHIAGSVNFAGARLKNAGGTALFADRADVSGRFFCGPGFCAEGEIQLRDARIGASLMFTGSRLSNVGGRALTAWGLEVGGIVNCCDGFTAEGLISFTSARIGSELCFEAAAIHGDLELDQIRAAVLRIDHATVIDGTMDVRRAVIEILRDEAAGWPRALHLDGFTYTTLVSPLPASERLAWLARDSDGYHPQPYEQLAALYRGMGNDADARTILLARQRIRRRALSRPLRAWGYLQDWTVGYGYRPQRAALWLAALLIIGTAAFTDHHPASLDRGQAPEFSPALYTLDLLLPIAGFGQKGAFNPRGWQHWLAAALIAAGWILATTIAAGVTRVLSRQ